MHPCQSFELSLQQINCDTIECILLVHLQSEFFLFFMWLTLSSSFQADNFWKLICLSNLLNRSAVHSVCNHPSLLLQFETHVCRSLECFQIVTATDKYVQVNKTSLWAFCYLCQEYEIVIASYWLNWILHQYVDLT